ncbi:MAG: hypothetical protein V3W19_11325, partial [Desulfatiglandales bacterium]
HSAETKKQQVDIEAKPLALPFLMPFFSSPEFKSSLCLVLSPTKIHRRKQRRLSPGKSRLKFLYLGADKV